MSNDTIIEDQDRSISVNYSYPAEHWKELRRFVEGDEMDPKKIFRLADDCWPAWKYAERGRPSNSSHYRYNFSKLRSWLKPYVKLYSYNNLLGQGGHLPRGAATLSYSFVRADRFIVERKIMSLIELASPDVFQDLWEAQLSAFSVGKNSSDPLPQTAVEIQLRTRPFWKEMSARYGAPLAVPPVARYRKKTPAELGADESKLIPDAVISQLVNKLALHRDRVVRLNPYNHLRLCVLLLVICLGRRIEEVLGAPREAGAEGPFRRHPCRRHGEEESSEALWFQFRPNKEGPSDLVYVSPEWEDLAIYCVRQILRYSDQVRDFAAPEERGLLILTSNWNLTAGNRTRTALPLEDNHDFAYQGGVPGGKRRLRDPNKKYHAGGLSYYSFCDWLIGCYSYGKWTPGVMQELNITADGSVDTMAYKLRTGQARHTRQSELARCPGVSLLARQRDLNHGDPGMQVYYQHVLNQENEELMSAVSKSPVSGHDKEWLNDLLGPGFDNGLNDRSPYSEGLVQLSTPRWRSLVESNRLYFESNAVDKGTCNAARGPSDCNQERQGKKAQNVEISVNHEGVFESTQQTGAASEKAKASGDVPGRGTIKPRKSESAEKVAVALEGGTQQDSASLVDRLKRRSKKIAEDKL